MSSSNAATATLPAPSAAPDPRGHSILDRVARWSVGGLLIALSGWLVYAQELFRYAEATVVAALLKPFLGDAVFPFRDHFVIRQDATHYMGLQITIECTTLVLLVPMLVFLALLLVTLRRTSWSRWAIGGAVGIAMITVINLIRIGMIAVSTLLWDHAGYQWSHVLVGSAFALVGIVATLIVTLRIIAGRRTRRSHP